MDRLRGWIVKQALEDWIAKQEQQQQGFSEASVPFTYNTGAAKVVETLKTCVRRRRLARYQAGTGRAWTEILELARAEKLTVDDACYLDLAIRRALPLFTQDRALANAAGRRGVAVSPA
jgi:predicted nucleic acid-binding protein